MSVVIDSTTLHGESVGSIKTKLAYTRRLLFSCGGRDWTSYIQLFENVFGVTLSWLLDIVSSKVFDESEAAVKKPKLSCVRRLEPRDRGMSAESF